MASPKIDDIAFKLKTKVSVGVVKKQEKSEMSAQEDLSKTSTSQKPLKSILKKKSNQV